MRTQVCIDGADVYDPITTPHAIEVLGALEFCGLDLPDVLSTS